MGSCASASPTASFAVGDTFLRGKLDHRARSLPSAGSSHGLDVVLSGGRGPDFWVSSSEWGEDAIIPGTWQVL